MVRMVRDLIESYEDSWSSLYIEVRFSCYSLSFTNCLVGLVVVICDSSPHIAFLV